MIIEEILDARDECVMMKITGEKVRFNRLRSLCKKYNEYEDEKVFSSFHSICHGIVHGRMWKHRQWRS